MVFKLKEDKVIFKKIREGAKIPERQHARDAGYDVFSVESTELEAGDTKAVATGIKMKLPENMEAQMRPRSGLSLSGITLMNSPGTIDSGYRGEIKIIMANLGEEDFRIRKGERIAQMVFSKVKHPEILEGEVDETDRGKGGFGSTGV